MQEVQIDTGRREYRINQGGVLRFNPTDPNVYSRFLKAVGAVEEIEKKMAQKSGERELSGKEAIGLLREADKAVKEQLTEVFGQDNDFEQLLDGVNLMAVCENGERVVTNLFAALGPIIEEGAERFLKAKAEVATAEAQRRRMERQGNPV